MASDAIRVDESAWPVVLVEVLRAPSDDEVHAFVARLEELASRRDAAFAIVLDARRKARLSTAQRKLVSAGFGRGAIAKHARAEAVLFASPLVVALGRLFLRLRRPKFRMGVFRDETAARQWALAHARS